MKIVKKNKTSVCSTIVTVTFGKCQKITFWPKYINAMNKFFEAKYFGQLFLLNFTLELSFTLTLSPFHAKLQLRLQIRCPKKEDNSKKKIERNKLGCACVKLHVWLEILSLDRKFFLSKVISSCSSKFCNLRCDRKCFPVTGNFFPWQKILPETENFLLWQEISSYDRIFLPVAENFFLWQEISSCNRKFFPVTGNFFLS